jgi:membrane dipeptidase
MTYPPRAHPLVLVACLWLTACPSKAPPSAAVEASASASVAVPVASASAKDPGWGLPGAPLNKDAPFTLLMHADTPYQLMKGKRIDAPKDVHLSLDRMRAGHLAAFAAVLFVEKKFHEQGAAQYCKRATEKIDAVLGSHASDLRPATSTAEFEANWRSGHRSLFRTVEGSWCLHGKTAFEDLHASGVRMIGLTWEGDHDFATSWVDYGHVGLTARGKRAVTRMNELGIAVDVSHMSDRAVDDVLAVAKAPVFASHSNARAVCNHPRNLKDDHIRAICASGGVIGLNFYPLHLRKSGKASLSDVVAHVRHVRDVGGLGCVGLGSDFDGIARGPEGLETPAELPNLRKAIVEDGFTSDEVASIFGGNFLRALGGVEKARKSL